MYILYRTSAPQPSTERLSTSSSIFNDALSDAACSECIHIGRSPAFPGPFGNVTALELDYEPPHDILRVPELFSLLNSMLHLQDLIITVKEGPILPAPFDAELPLVPFSLRRLVLSGVFPGWIYLLNSSCNTLECLCLGFRQNDPRAVHAPRYTDMCEGVSLSVFPRLRALRMEDMPEPFLLSGCARLTSLTVYNDIDNLSVVQFALHSPLAHLTVLALEFTDADSECLAEALVELPVFRVLRTLTVEISALDVDLQLAGHRGRMVLADTCRARRIAVSVVRMRQFCEWEQLDIAPRRVS